MVALLHGSAIKKFRSFCPKSGREGGENLVGFFSDRSTAAYRRAAEAVQAGNPTTEQREMNERAALVRTVSVATHVLPRRVGCFLGSNYTHTNGGSGRAPREPLALGQQRASVSPWVRFPGR